MDELTSAPEKETNITDWWKPVDTPYVEYILIYPSNLMITIEIDIRKHPLPRRVAAIWSTDQTIEWSLALRKTAGSYCNLLLVVSDHESYPT